MHRRRLRRTGASLEITAFLNLIVVLVPFLLSTAVLSRLAVLELALPPPEAAMGAAPALEKLQLEVIVRADSIELADRVGGRLARLAAGDGELRALAAQLLQLKQRFPDERHAAVLAEPGTRYERLVQVMAAVRATPGAAAGELFPLIALGDAPRRAEARS